MKNCESCAYAGETREATHAIKFPEFGIHHEFCSECYEKALVEMNNQINAKIDKQGLTSDYLSTLSEKDRISEYEIRSRIARENAKKRWANTTPEERTNEMRRVAKFRWKKK